MAGAADHGVFHLPAVSPRVCHGHGGHGHERGASIGPTLGGWQTDANGWRSIFLTMTIIGVISLLAAMFGLHNFGSHDPSARADFFSVCLSVIGFGG